MEAKTGRKQIVTVKLAYEPDGTENDDIDLISMDLEQEISSCWHTFDVISIEVEQEGEAK